MRFGFFFFFFFFCSCWGLGFVNLVWVLLILFGSIENVERKPKIV
jgi:hypothetical protein